jgi:hypothetical protein
LVEKTGVPWENHWPGTSHCQNLSRNVVTLMVIGTDCIGSCKSNYRTITTALESKSKHYMSNWCPIIKDCPILISK